MRRVVGSGLLVTAIVLVAAALLATGTGLGQEGTDATQVSDADLVGVTENDSLWPHTSRSRSTAGRTLAMNLLVLDDAGSVADTLGRLDDPDWRPANETVEEPNVSLDAGPEEVELVWQAAHGGTRYTYVERDGRGRWLDERRQLHSGTYLATRDHVRLYAPSDAAGWTTLQVHREYWDWFRFRHTVTDVVDSREQLRDDLTSRSYRTVDRSTDERGGNGRMVVVERATLVGVVLAVPLAGRRVADGVARVRDGVARRPGLRLGGFVLAVPLAVRAAGVLGELAIAGHSPKLVAAGLYPVLVIGLPLGVASLAADASPRRAFAVAGVAFLLTIAADFLAIGPVVPPPSVVSNRVTLAVGLGAVGAGSASDGRFRRVLLVAATAVWCLGVLTPLGIGVP